MGGSMRITEDKRRGCMIERLTLGDGSQIALQIKGMHDWPTIVRHPCCALFQPAAEAFLFETD